MMPAVMPIPVPPKRDKEAEAAEIRGIVEVIQAADPNVREEDIADKIGISTKTLWTWKVGKHSPSLAELRELRALRSEYERKAAKRKK